MRRLVFIVALSALSVPALPDVTNSNSAREWVVDGPAVFSAARLERNAVDRRRPVRGSYGPDPTILALVDRVASEIGIPTSVMREHVRRESGFRPAARNPRSSATGLLQVVKGSHEAIIGRKLTMAEHVRLSSDPEHSLRVGAAHMRACMGLMPGASPAKLYGCHYHGHARFGGRIEMAAAFYRPDRNGWLARGSVAMPWSREDRG